MFVVVSPGSIMWSFCFACFDTVFFIVFSTLFLFQYSKTFYNDTNEKRQSVQHKYDRRQNQIWCAETTPSRNVACLSCANPVRAKRANLLTLPSNVLRVWLETNIWGRVPSITKYLCLSAQNLKYYLLTYTFFFFFLR